VISKAEATRIPVFGWGLRHAPMILVERARRGTNLHRVLRESAATLADGRSILIYPEGTRVPPGKRLPFQRGLEAICAACPVPVVPVVHNAGLFWTRGFQPKKAGVVTLKFFPPQPPDRPPKQRARELERFIVAEKDLLLDFGPKDK